MAGNGRTCIQYGSWKTLGSRRLGTRSGDWRPSGRRDGDGERRDGDGTAGRAVADMRADFKEAFAIPGCVTEVSPAWPVRGL